MNDFKEMHRQLVHVEERRDTEHDYACLASEASDVAVHPHVGVLSDGHRPLVVWRVGLQHSNHFKQHHNMYEIYCSWLRESNLIVDLLTP